MSDTTGRRMDAVEIAEFMTDQETGTLALADGDESYAIPVAFAYDEDGPDVYLRLGYGPDSEKRRFVEESDRVSFVVYDRTRDGWRSVVARGRPEVVSETSLGSAIAERVNELDIPYFRVFDRPASELEFNLVRIDVQEIDGLVAGE